VPVGYATGRWVNFSGTALGGTVSIVANGTTTIQVSGTTPNVADGTDVYLEYTLKDIAGNQRVVKGSVNTLFVPNTPPTLSFTLSGGSIIVESGTD
jgi:prolipoprotein diacylglyceryltransferase